MYQHLVINANGIIDAKQSMIRALNAMFPIENAIMDIDMVGTIGGAYSFAITFSRQDMAKEFFEAHRELGTLDVLDVTKPRIILNAENSFIYLFHTLIKTQALLTDPDVPPFARVNLLKLFATQVLEPFIFHGMRQDEMKVGFNPIQFIEGKIVVRLRGQTPQNINTIVDYDNFDELALICFTTPEMARHIIPLKQLLLAVRMQYVMDNYKGPIDQQLKLHPLKVSAIVVEDLSKRLFLEVSGDKLAPKTFKEAGEFKYLLQQTLGDGFHVNSSLHLGRATVEIIPAEGFLFNETDVATLTHVLQEKADVIFLSSKKEALVRSLTQLNDLCAQEDEVRYSFERVHALAEIFRDPVMRDMLKAPVVIDNSGISFSEITIQSLMDSGNRANPLTRQPMESNQRENKLLDALKSYYSKNPAHLVPPMLHGIKTAVILPSGETVDKASMVQLFTEQNHIAMDKILPETQATLPDGITLHWRDLWPNLAVQEIIGFYNQPLRLNRDERILEYPNPMLSLAATIASLLDSEAAMTKDEAEALLESNPMAMPVHVIWSSDPAGLRLNFKSTELERLILCLLTRNDIAAVSSEVLAPFKKCIFLPAESEQGKENIKKFIYDICKYNRESAYFEECFSSREFRYDSRAKARRVDEATGSSNAASSNASVVNEEQKVFNFLRAMYYGTLEEVKAHYDALPAVLKQKAPFGGIGYTRMASQAVSAQIPAAAFVTSAHTPLALLRHVSILPVLPQPSVRLNDPSVPDAVPLVGASRQASLPLHGMTPISTRSLLGPVPAAVSMRARLPSIVGTASAPMRTDGSHQPPIMRSPHLRFFEAGPAPRLVGAMGEASAATPDSPAEPHSSRVDAPAAAQASASREPEARMDVDKSTGPSSS